MGAIKQTVSHDFVTMDVPKKLSLGVKVIDLMGTNVSKFSNPTVPITGDDVSLQDAQDKLKAAKEAFDKNPAKEDDLHNAETTWIGRFSQDAVYVDSVSAGDPAVIDLSGFNKTKDTREKATKPGSPVVKSTKSTTTGSLESIVAKQKDANVFISVAYTPDMSVVFNDNQVIFSITKPDGTVAQASFAYAKKRKSKYSGLKSKSDVKTQALAINAAGFSDPSAPTDNGIL